ncbi:MAG: DNA polymerase III subunit gamma/tau, partial [Bacteroidales bacterium]|nr:DNA polymerase III subunit gamma/tau [Bacteroidales bacterium]
EKHKILPTILSRCQVFDFKRIKAEDIVAHLRGIADKEGVSYEEESLHIIARKAEGGLRDALSTFDQLVSFTRGNLTRQLCNENLNLLDADYYFRLVDYSRAGDLSNTLLLYQEVIEKGYEGQHFITGLSEHLRNLMVSIDPATHKLMEVSDALRARYGQQSAACGLALLLRWLDISSDYEYRYKEAGNKRLFIEVALMKLATAVTNP